MIYCCRVFWARQSKRRGRWSVKAVRSELRGQEKGGGPELTFMSVLRAISYWPLEQNCRASSMPASIFLVSVASSTMARQVSRCKTEWGSEERTLPVLASREAFITCNATAGLRNAVSLVQRPIDLICLVGSVNTAGQTFLGNSADEAHG